MYILLILLSIAALTAAIILLIPLWQAVSLASYAYRVGRAERIPIALRLFWKARMHNITLRLFARKVPKNWKVKKSLTEATAALFQLEKSASIASVVVPSFFMHYLSDITRDSSEALMTIAARVVAVVKQDVSSMVVYPQLERDHAQLQRLLSAIEESRESLAKLSLADEGEDALSPVTSRLRTLDELVKDTTAAPPETGY